MNHTIEKISFDSVKFAFQLWTSLCREEIKRSRQGTDQKYITTNLDALLQIIFKGLEMTQFDEDDTSLEQTGDDA